MVRELIKKWPDLAKAIDDDANSPLHLACKQGHREIASTLLRHDPSLALQNNHNGYTPLHLAVINGSVSILSDFASTVAPSFLYLTRESHETVFILAARHGRYDALVFLEDVPISQNLLRHTDQGHNSVLHVAVAGGHLKVRN